MIAHASPHAWMMMANAVKIALLVGFSATGILGIIVIQDSCSDWHHRILGRLILLFSLAGIALTVLAVRP